MFSPVAIIPSARDSLYYLKKPFSRHSSLEAQYVTSPRLGDGNPRRGYRRKTNPDFEVKCTGMTSLVEMKIWRKTYAGIWMKSRLGISPLAQYSISLVAGYRL